MSALPASLPEVDARAARVEQYVKASAIELVLNSLVDDPEALFEHAELLGTFDSAFEVTRASSLALELWPTDPHSDVDVDDEPAERLAAEHRAHLLASVIFSRLAASPDLLAEHAARHAEIAARQPLRLV